MHQHLAPHQHAIVLNDKLLGDSGTSAGDMFTTAERPGNLECDTLQVRVYAASIDNGS